MAGGRSVRGPTAPVAPGGSRQTAAQTTATQAVIQHSSRSLKVMYRLYNDFHSLNE